MLQLIGMELHKIIEKRAVMIGIILLCGMNYLLSEGIMRQQVMRTDGTYAAGQEAVRLDQDIAKQYEGLLTDEKVQQILKDAELPEGFSDIYGPAGYVERNNMYKSLWSFRDENGHYNGKTIEEVYGTEAGKLQIGYNKSWTSLLYGVSFVLIFGLCYLIIVALTPVFSEEYGRGMDALILTSRYGRSKCAWAKVLAASLFTLLITGICVGVNLGFVVAQCGTAGLNGSLQFNYVGLFMTVPYEITFRQALFYAVCIWLSAAFYLTGMSLLISSFLKSSFSAIILTVLVYSAPMFLTAGDEIGYILVSLFPAQQINLQAPYEVGAKALFGIPVPFQVIVVVFNLLVCFLCVCLARRTFARHQVAE